MKIGILLSLFALFKGPEGHPRINYFRSRTLARNLSKPTQITGMFISISILLLLTIGPPGFSSQWICQFVTYQPLWVYFVGNELSRCVGRCHQQLPSCITRRTDISFDTIRDNTKIKIIRVWPQGILRTILIDNNIATDSQFYLLVVKVKI